MVSKSAEFMSPSRTVWASACCAALSCLKRVIASVWFSGSSLLGSIGGCPPLGEASVSSTPASRNTKYGAANSSSQKPVLRPVLPSRSWEVNTMRIFIFSFFLVCVVYLKGQNSVGLGDQARFVRPPEGGEVPAEVQFEV